jgi:hypothetical protein
MLLERLYVSVVRFAVKGTKFITTTSRFGMCMCFETYDVASGSRIRKQWWFHVIIVSIL